MAREKDLLRLPADFMPLDQAAVLREMLTAYRLLEDQPGLKVGPPAGRLPPAACPSCLSREGVGVWWVETAHTSTC